MVKKKFFYKNKLKSQFHFINMVTHAKVLADILGKLENKNTYTIQDFIFPTSAFLLCICKMN